MFLRDIEVQTCERYEIYKSIHDRHPEAGNLLILLV